MYDTYCGHNYTEIEPGNRNFGRLSSVTTDVNINLI
jgi:hypothetical protein